MCFNKFKIVLTLYAYSAVFAGCAGSANSVVDGLKPTIYYKPTVVVAREQFCMDVVSLYSLAEKPIVELCAKDYHNCLMQGSCFVQSAHQQTYSVNFHSMRNGVARFTEVNLQKCPFGYGVSDICLDPYYSVAADLNFYNPGDVIFVPRAVGVKTPHGDTHDGYFIVRDSGGSIIGEKRFDFFTGFESHLTFKNSFAKIGLGDPKNRFEFRRVTGEEAEHVLRNRNYPLLNQFIYDVGHRHLKNL